MMMMMMHFPEHFQKSLRFFDFWKIEIEKSEKMKNRKKSKKSKNRKIKNVGQKAKKSQNSVLSC